MKNTIRIIGSGLTGSTIARILAQSNKFEVEVYESKLNVGGNVYDPIHESGLRIHAHGPHAFHTNSLKIFKFLSEFTSWRFYEHKVLANIDGIEVPVPCNFTSLAKLNPIKAKSWIEILKEKFNDNQDVPILKLLNSEDAAVVDIAKFVYEKFFVGYTKKQWDLTPDQLSPSVTSRVPVRMGYDDRYFKDTYQFIPVPGYFELIENLLNHKNIKIFLNKKFTLKENNPEIKTVFTGPIDELFNYFYGDLEYRSLNLDFKYFDLSSYQSASQINFPLSERFTRISEFKHMTGQVHGGTVVCFEYPIKHIRDLNDRYYPIPIDSNRDLHKKYLLLAAEETPNITFAGRLADYKYYNMDQAVARGMSVALDQIL